MTKSSATRRRVVGNAKIAGRRKRLERIDVNNVVAQDVRSWIKTPTHSNRRDSVARDFNGQEWIENDPMSRVLSKYRSCPSSIAGVRHHGPRAPSRKGNDCVANRLNGRGGDASPQFGHPSRCLLDVVDDEVAVHATR